MDIATQCASQCHLKSYFLLILHKLLQTYMEELHVNTDIWQTPHPYQKDHMELY